MKTIILLVGNSASGKTALAKQFINSSIYIPLFFSEDGRNLSCFLNNKDMTNQIEDLVYSKIVDYTSRNKLLIVDGISSYGVLRHLLYSDVTVKIVEVYSSYFVRINRIRKELHISFLKAMSLEREKRKNKKKSGLNRIICQSEYLVRNSGDLINSLKQFEYIIQEIENEYRKDKSKQ